MTVAPNRTAGDAEALRAAGALELGSSLRLFGESGNSKTHIAVWTASRLIRKHAVEVKFLDERALETLAYRFNEPADFMQESIILADDLDKVMPGKRQSAVAAAQATRARPDATRDG